MSERGDPLTGPELASALRSFLPASLERQCLLGDEIREPEPYTEEEFPQWAHNLRRFEIITLGTLPITFLATFLVYDLIRYTSSGFDSDYALLGSPNPVPYSTEEKIGVVVAACSASLLIALMDFIIGKARQPTVEKPSHEQY